MRIFIIKSDTAYIDTGKQAFQSGRLDVVLNSMLIAMIGRRADKLVIRQNVTVIAVMPRNNPPIIMINSNKLHDPVINEVDFLKFILNNIKNGNEEHIGAQGNIETIIRDLKRDNYEIFYLHEKGTPIKKFLPLNNKTAFILGNQDGLSQMDEWLIKREGIAAVSLGSRPYMTWECIAILNSILDGTISFV